jgi:hypothetical protein
LCFVAVVVTLDVADRRLNNSGHSVRIERLDDAGSATRNCSLSVFVQTPEPPPAHRCGFYRIQPFALLRALKNPPKRVCFMY